MAGMNFLILKINGVDVSQMSHEEAVQMFLRAPEPILVEVRRRLIDEKIEANIRNPIAPFKSSASTSTIDKCSESMPLLPILLPQESPSKYLLDSLLPPLLPASLSSLVPVQPSSSLSVSIASSPPLVDLNNLQNSIISSSQSGMSLASSSCGSNGGGLTFAAGFDIEANTKTLQLSQQMYSDNIAPSSSMSISSIIPVAVSFLSNDDSNSAVDDGIFVKNAISNDSISENVAECSNLTSPSNSSSSKKCKVYISTGVQTDTFTTDFIFNGSSIVDPDHIENEHHLFEECLAPEIDIEEVTLRKSTSNERIGLTVSNSSGGGNGSGSDDTDTCTEVYISDIIPDGIAARDGRLRHGDQILQVNGRDVSNKEETETLISENKNAVTLLVSRYLYTDEDFNDPAEYYDEEGQNVVYENCFIENCIIEHQTSSENKTNTSSSSTSNKSGQKNQISIQPPMSPFSQAILKSNHSQSSDLLFNDPLNPINIKEHLASVNQQIAMLDTRMQNMMMHSKTDPSRAGNIETIETIENLNNLYRSPVDSMRNELVVTPSTVQSPLPQGRKLKFHTAVNSNLISSAGQADKFKQCTNSRVIDSETEHIYETIPEDSESEPVYCSPYESSNQNKLVEQWLDMHSADPKIRIRSQQRFPKPSKTLQPIRSAVIWHRMNGATSRSNNSSCGDEHENSSSAYNTGGSCNSNNTQLTLELSSNVKDKDEHCQSTFVLCPPKFIVSPEISGLLKPDSIQHQTYQHQSIPQDFNDNCKDCFRLKKDKASPTHGQKTTQAIITSKPPVANSLCHNHQAQQINYSKNDSTTVSTQQHQVPTDTMYTNVANLQQTMCLQQKLFRQALIQQASTSTVGTVRQHFTAPSLSQYHFVSSQEVSSSVIHPPTIDEQMVWKVKRRKDGTRYIVRRPVRNRILQNRAAQITEERNDLTTEDDTISEIKTGRYWTKEERKKHIERAKERRQRQQIVILNKTNASTSIQPQQYIRAEPLVNNRGNQIGYSLQQQPSSLVPSGLSSNVGSSKLYRQNTINNRLTSGTTSSEPTQPPLSSLHKKCINSKKPIKVDSGSVDAKAPTIPHSATTSTPNSNKMVGLLSVTTV